MRLAASLPVPPDLPACQRAARRMEELGYDSVWIADSGAGPDAFVVATAVACVTSRLRIGTAVVRDEAGDELAGSERDPVRRLEEEGPRVGRVHDDLADARRPLNGHGRRSRN